MNNDPKFSIGNLAPGNPIMEPLGRYFAEFATLEFGLVMMMARILGHGDNNDVAVAITKHIRNISTRIQIIRDAAIAARLSVEVLNAVNVICDEFVTANARRNVYAHGVYEASEDGQIRIKTYVMTASRKQETIYLSTEDVEKDVAQVRMCLGLKPNQRLEGSQLS